MLRLLHPIGRLFRSGRSVRTQDRRHSLADERVGFDGVIAELVGPTLLTERLRELGFVPGEPVKIVGCAPFGEPLLVIARGATIALRKTEAACLKV